MTDHDIAIRSRRAASNAAIAARDADATVAIMAEDVTVAVAGGPLLAGREASRRAFLEQFADQAFRGYVRETLRIEFTGPDGHATESGRWAGRWQHGLRREEMRGSYVAQWTRTDGEWMLQSEVFLPGPA
jgi:ketosteroid isomerase-like protein